MRKQQSIHIDLIHSLLTGPLSHGVDVNALFQLISYDPKLLKDNDARLPIDKFGPLIRAIWKLMDDEASGFLSQPLKKGFFAMMCHATITCPNLRRAFLRGNRFHRLLIDDCLYSLSEKGEEATLYIDYSNPNKLDPVFWILSLFVIQIRWASWLIDKPLLLERINFTFNAPSFKHEINDIFPCRLFFNQTRNSVVFSTRFLDIPIVQDAQSLSNFLAHAPECLLTQYQSDNSLTAQIRHMLQHSECVENLSFDIVAKRLHMTTQTLRRRLKEEGNSFRDIKDSIRRNTAIYHLAQQSMPINDIAMTMGFSEPSAFNRAFKKWTGITPGAYREQAKQQSIYRNRFLQTID